MSDQEGRRPSADIVAGMPSILDSVRAMQAPVMDAGGRWMLHPEVLGSCKDAGYPNGFVYYVTGRGGVLGDVDADVVVSAFAFFEPGLVRKMWEGGVGVEGPRKSAARYGAACAEFGRSRLQGFDRAARLAELAEKLVMGVDPSGLTLFAGWRAESLPDDAAGRAYFLTHVLRELRGSAHIVAVIAEGLHPMEAVLASGGEATAQRFGWQGPFPEIEPLRATRAAAEARTDVIMEQLVASVLSEDEAAELAQLVAAMRSHMDTATGS
jgi:hypothetical protein